MLHSRMKRAWKSERCQGLRAEHPYQTIVDVDVAHYAGSAKTSKKSNNNKNGSSGEQNELPNVPNAALG